MPSHDATTLNFYTSEAVAYAAQGEANHDRLEPFLEALPTGGTILELGCGGGQDSEAMLAHGFDVIPTDGTRELARQAEKRLGRPVRVLLFADLAEQNRYDGVWANACLLHVPRAELPGIIGRIHTALKMGGVFYASFKAGSQEGRDQFGRYYNYPSPEWLRAAYDPAQWQSIEIDQTLGRGYDGQPTYWLHVTAKKLG
jgi:SAM-dependent methyltransferase